MSKFQGRVPVPQSFTIPTLSLDTVDYVFRGKLREIGIIFTWKEIHKVGPKQKTFFRLIWGFKTLLCRKGLYILLEINSVLPWLFL